VTIAIDGHAQGTSTTSGTTVSASLTTANTGDVIVAIVEACDQGNFPGVTLSDAGNKIINWKLQYEIPVVDKVTVQVWWGTAATTMTTNSITATFDRNITRKNIIVFGVSGANTTNPFDSNSTIFPGSIATGSGFGQAAITAAFSTSCTNSMLVVLCGSTSNNTLNSPTAGYTSIEAISGNSGGTISCAQKVVSATQSSITPQMSGNIGNGTEVTFGFAIAAAGETACQNYPPVPLFEGVNGTGQTTSQSSIATTITTNHSNEIILAIVGRQSNVSVTGISGTGTSSWTQYSSTQHEGTDDYVDIWYGIAASPLAAVSITATFSGATPNSSMVLTGLVSNGNTASPFDSNGSVPSFNGNTSTQTIQGAAISTTATIGTGLLITGGAVRPAQVKATPSLTPFNVSGQITGTGNNQSVGLYAEWFASALSSKVWSLAANGSGDWLAIETALQLPSVPSASGTWASTETADTFAGSGGTLNGTWASTEAKDTFAGAGGTLGGSWASTEARDTFAGIGAPQANATMAVTEAADAFAGAGYPQMIGSWASTESPDVFAAFAVEQVRGSMYLSEIKDTFAGIGLSTIQATMTAHEAADTLAVAGYPALFGTFTPTEAKDTLTVVADPGFGIEAHATGHAHDTNTCNVSLTTVYDDALMVLAIYTGGFWNHANVSTVSDSTGQTWHKRNVRHHSGGKQDFELWWAKKHTAGATTITVTTTGTTGFICLEALGIHRANLDKPWDTHTGAGSGVDNWGSGNPKGTLYSNATDTLALAWYQSNDGASTGDVSHLQDGAFSSPTVNPASWTWLERVTANETNGFSGRLESAYGRFHSQLSPVQVQFGGTFGARNVLVMQDVLVAADDPNVATVATDDIIRWHFDGHGQQVVVQLDPSTTDVTLTSFQTYEADTIAVAAIMIQSPTQGRVESITDTADFSPGWTRRSIVTTPDGKLSLEIWWCHFTTAYSNGNLVVHCDSNTHTGDIVGVVAWGINGPSEFLRGVIWDGDSSLPATAESIIASNQTVGPFNTLNANVLEINVAANIGSGGIDGTGGLEGLNQLPWLQFLGDFFGSPSGLLDSGAPPFNVALDFKFSAPAVSADTAEVDLTSPRPDKWLMIADALPVGPPSPPEGRWASTDAKDRATHAGDFTSIGISSPGGWVGYVPATATMAATDQKDLPTNSGAFTAIWNTSGWIGFIPAFTDNVNWTESKDVMHSGVWVLGPETILAFFEATEAKDRISTNRLFTSYTTADSIGNRTSRITASTNASIDSGTASNLVDGSKTNGPSHALSVTNSQPAAMYFSFDFGTARIVNEAKWYQNGSFAQPGLWKWQGSSNGTTWTDLSTTFTLDGGNGGSVIGNLSANITAYRYYRILQTTNAGGSDIPWLWEIEFKVEGIGGTLAITEFKDRANYQVRVVPKVDPPPPRKRRALIVT
jgi:hypothetical protein